MDFAQQLFTIPLFQNSLVDWLLAIFIATALFAALLTARSFIRRYHKRLQATERTELAEIPVEVLSSTTLAFFLILSVFVGLGTLNTGPKVAVFLNSVLTIAVFWQAGVWLSAGATAFLERKRRRAVTTDRAVAGSLGVIGFIVRVVIWALVLLLTLDNLGIDVTALVAGLGIGGIAVALAVQNILGDLFASLSITFDKPFLVGDFLIVDDFLGSVEYIGIKTTRLRSLGGEQIIISNANLLNSRMRNYGRMYERRVVFSIQLSHETSIDLVERVPGMIREIIQSLEGTRFDRSHFAKRSAGAFEFETVYYVLSPDYNRYMDIQQAINLRLHRDLEKLGVAFAHPTQRVLLSRADGEPLQEGERREVA
jgi:small-conductance mechanosensitive channel